MLEKLLAGKQTAAVICGQWGDTGKGAVVDALAEEWADVIARGTGGNNAGHTVVINGKTHIFNLIPSGILHDEAGKINILGNGMVLDLARIGEELDVLDREGVTYNNLIISGEANIILPYHITRDRANNQSQANGGIGSTGKGIGPAYSDKIARRGVPLDILVKGEDAFINFFRSRKISSFNPDANPEEIYHNLKGPLDRIKPFVKDARQELYDALDKGQKVLLEGAQGTLLSIEHGSYPYVTSSDPTLNGAAGGVGLSARDIEIPLILFKFPFMTRVGGGPFPTEFGGEKSADHCCRDPEPKVRDELELVNIPFKELEGGKVKYDINHPKIRELMNSEDGFEQGIGLRLAAGEYGATTQRSRRTGWTDLVSAKYALRVNGSPHIVLTKTDCVSGMDKLKLCVGYEVNGQNIPFSRDPNILSQVNPVYHNFAGFDESIGDVKTYEMLPTGLKMAIKSMEHHTLGNVVLAKNGPDRNQYIEK